MAAAPVTKPLNGAGAKAVWYYPMTLLAGVSGDEATEIGQLRPANSERWRVSAGSGHQTGSRGSSSALGGHQQPTGGLAPTLERQRSGIPWTSVNSFPLIGSMISKIQRRRERFACDLRQELIPVTSVPPISTNLLVFTATPAIDR